VNRVFFIALSRPGKRHSLKLQLVPGSAGTSHTTGKNRWGYLNADSIEKFCIRYDVPKRGDKRTWSGDSSGNMVGNGGLPD
jgi:hypothetical protein